MNQITPADISDPQEVIARAAALSLELATPITPGFEALVFKAARGIENIYELTYIRKDGSRFPAVVSVTALRDAQSAAPTLHGAVDPGAGERRPDHLFAQLITPEVDCSVMSSSVTFTQPPRYFVPVVLVGPSSQRNPATITCNSCRLGELTTQPPHRTEISSLVRKCVKRRVGTPPTWVSLATALSSC
jgi:hypothetical protein